MERIIEAVDLLEREFGWTRTGEEMERLADSKGAEEIMDDIRRIADALREERNDEEGKLYGR